MIRCRLSTATGGIPCAPCPSFSDCSLNASHISQLAARRSCFALSPLRRQQGARCACLAAPASLCTANMRALSLLPQTPWRSQLQAALPKPQPTLLLVLRHWTAAVFTWFDNCNVPKKYRMEKAAAAAPGTRSWLLRLGDGRARWWRRRGREAPAREAPPPPACAPTLSHSLARHVLLNRSLPTLCLAPSCDQGLPGRRTPRSRPIRPRLQCCSRRSPRAPARSSTTSIHAS